MKRVVVVWLGMLVVLAGGAFTSGGRSAEAQDGTQATVAALETKVAKQATSIAKRDEKIAELRTRVAEGEAAVPEPTPSPEQAAPTGESSVLGGNAVNLLPPGEKGKVDVVLVGPYDGTRLPIVVRNNTDKDIQRVSVSAVARTAGGDLIAAGGDQSFRPFGVAAGGYALGYIYFDGTALPADAAFEFEVQSEPDTGDRSFSPVDVDVKEATFLGDRIVGELVNNSDFTVSTIGVSAMCLAADGSVLGFQDGYVDKEQTAPGESAPFQISIYDGTDCTNFVVAANGYNF